MDIPKPLELCYFLSKLFSLEINLSCRAFIFSYGSSRFLSKKYKTIDLLYVPFDFNIKMIFQYLQLFKGVNFKIRNFPQIGG